MYWYIVSEEIIINNMFKKKTPISGTARHVDISDTQELVEMEVGISFYMTHRIIFNVLLSLLSHLLSVYE